MFDTLGRFQGQLDSPLRAETPGLPVPQDAILALEGQGTIREIACGDTAG